MTTFSVIIPAAGGGSRAGGSAPKQYVELLGRPVLAHTLAAFSGLPGLLRIVVAVDPARLATARLCAEGLSDVEFVQGGSERQHSIANALELIGDEPELVLVHDAARPCASASLIERVVEAAARHGAAIPALPIAETVKRIDAAGRVIETVPRESLRAAQTPQGFRRELLADAYRHAAAHRLLGTDDASLVEAYGASVAVVEGELTNLKITYADDFGRAEEILRNRSMR